MSDPMEFRKAALLRVSGSLIAQMLKLPENWTVQRIIQPYNIHYDDAICLVVTGEGLPDVPIGSLLPELDCIVTRHEDGSVTAECTPQQVVAK